MESKHPRGSLNEGIGDINETDTCEISLKIKLMESKMTDT